MNLMKSKVSKSSKETNKNRGMRGLPTKPVQNVVGKSDLAGKGPRKVKKY